VNFYQAYKMAIKSILGGKVRSFLTMLGVIIGVASVITAVSFAKGSTKNVTDSISSLGTNLIQVSITGRNSNRNISYDDLLKFQEETGDDISAIAPQITGSITVKVGSKTRSTSLIGTSPEYEIVKNIHVQSGRFLLSYDIDYQQKIALVGTAVVKDVFEGISPYSGYISAAVNKGLMTGMADANFHPSDGVKFSQAYTTT
jgi:putative ABC transport system permease protein